ncbi:hypothetical protein RJ639_008619 [Escallonia herrerae]|uniref:Cullin N-terminal domain-containing protein n=1 Tax=Escallonia herrerae TaxID=1293975 RepID=A0AA89ARY0_9ASTE|nr:hypothetical protein RJ639_008619 [Escallonia herrerae]
MCERVSLEQWLNLVDEAINKAKTIFDDDHVVDFEPDELVNISFYFDTHDQAAQLLYELLKMWRKYKQLLCWLSRMLEPLDKMYFAGEGHSLHKIGVTYFCEEVSEDREGKLVDRELINNTIGFLMETDAVARRDYYNAFENALREDSGLYYSRLASTWILNDTFSVYINKVERILHEEGRIRYFLPQETIERLLETRMWLLQWNVRADHSRSEHLSPEQWLNLVDEAINKTKSIFDDDHVAGFEFEELIDISFTIFIRVAEAVGKVQAIGMLVIKNVGACGENIVLYYGRTPGSAPSRFQLDQTALATPTRPSFKKKWCDFHKWEFHSTDDCKRNPKNKNSIMGYTSRRSPSQPATDVTDTVVSVVLSSSTSTMELTADELDVQTAKVVGTGCKVDHLFALDHLHLPSTSVAVASTSSKALQL